MEDDFNPETEPAGSLDPPPRKPPTAVTAAGSSRPEHPPHSLVSAPATPNAFGRFLSRAFDVIDEAADDVAKTLHIGPPRPGS